MHRYTVSFLCPIQWDKQEKNYKWVEQWTSLFNMWRCGWICSLSWRRYVKYGKRGVQVFHCGNHTCPVTSRPKKPTEYVKETIKKHPRLKQAEIQSARMVLGYWSVAILFWQPSIDHIVNVQCKRCGLAKTRLRHPSLPFDSLPYPTHTIRRRVHTYARSITWQPDEKRLTIFYEYGALSHARFACVGAPLVC